MLDIIPTSWFSWNFSVSEGSSAVGAFDISWWRERGELTVQGRRFRAYRESAMTGDFLLESESGIVARATKPSFLRRSFTVQTGAKTYTLRARTAFRRAFVLFDGDREIGAISARSVWSQRASANLPADISLPVQVFLVWLTLLLWKREADSASTSG